MFYKQTPVKITGYGLAAGCQVFYRKIYGLFFTVYSRKKEMCFFVLPTFAIRHYAGWYVGEGRGRGGGAARVQYVEPVLIFFNAVLLSSVNLWYSIARLNV